MKRGPKPKEKVSRKWSPELAYCIGLIVTDGSLSKTGRHVSFTSKDKQLIELYKKLLCLDNKIGRKGNGIIADKKYYVIQFGDIIFYNFLLSIGLMQNKTKIISAVSVPKKYYRDFLRGHFDGDGSSYGYKDCRYPNSYMFYTSFVSASAEHIYWLREINREYFGVVGHITKSDSKSFFQLKYAKRESLVIIRKMYYNSEIACLERKKDKLFRDAQVEKLVDSLP